MNCAASWQGVPWWTGKVSGSFPTAHASPNHNLAQTENLEVQTLVTVEDVEVNEDDVFSLKQDIYTTPSMAREHCGKENRKKCTRRRMEEI